MSSFYPPDWQDSVGGAVLTVISTYSKTVIKQAINPTCF